MGLSLELYAGEAIEIGADFTAFEFDGLRDGSRARAYADFSLHLSPTDLDILSELIAERVGAAPLLLNDSLIQKVGGIENESGAEVVDPAWVQIIAATDQTTAEEITSAWIGRIADECGQQLDVTTEAVTAVRLLINLCRVAVRENVDVVHTWYL